MASAQPSPEDVKAEREREREHRMEMAGLNGQPRLDELPTDRDYLREITESDIDISQGSMDLLENLLSTDLVLAFFDDPEVHEAGWEMRIFEEAYKSMHPPAESVVQGPFRQVVFDDDRPEAHLQSLTQQEEFQAMAIFRAAWARITRSREGAQQETLRMSIDESRISRDSEGSNSSGGVISRVFG